MAFPSNTKRYTYLMAMTVFFLVSLNSTVCGGEDQHAYHIINSARNSVDRTPRWSSDGSKLIVNIGNDIIGMEIEGYNDVERWKIPIDDTDDIGNTQIIRLAPRIVNDGRLEYKVYLYTVDNSIWTEPLKKWNESVNIDGTESRKENSYRFLSPNGSFVAYIRDFDIDAYGYPIVVRSMNNESETIWAVQPGYTPDFWKIQWSEDSEFLVLQGEQIHKEERGSRRDELNIITYDRTGKVLGIIDKIHQKEHRLYWLYLIKGGPLDNRVYYAKSIKAEGIDPYRSWIRIFSSELDGSNREIIHDFGVNKGSIWSHAELSPDGRSILIISSENRADDRLYLLEIDGGNVRELRSGDRLFASWSPDGSRIAVQEQTETGLNYIYIMKPDGSYSRELIRPRYNSKNDSRVMTYVIP